MRYSVLTFGCRVNQADSLTIESGLAAAGGEAVSSEHADVVIVNTCSVTASADQGARQTIRRIARTNPTARIIATGCYATRCSTEVADLPGVSEVVANDRKLTIPLSIAEGHCGHVLGPGLMGRTAWTLRVQTGCEEHCSYCIIPSTRGASRSRSVADIGAEIDRVLAAGYKEIAITGVHLGSYGRDLMPRSSLSELLCRLLNDTHTVDRWLLRVSSLEPMDFPPAILELMNRSAGPRIAPHFHLPMQHASNRVLELMQRPYTIEYFRDLVDEIRARVPHAAIGSDVIVGFPGETDDDFAELADYLEQSPLTHLHVFPYSDRPGTAASTLPGKVHGTVVKARGQRVREISRVLSDRFRATQSGTIRPALTIDDGSVAVTDNYFRVPAPAGHARNDWIFVSV
jgi:threonylcarbamoyladenosine tRNA methylthiotransferase MtaB